MSSREPALTQLDRQRFTLCLQRQKGNSETHKIWSQRDSETHKIWSSPSFHTHPDVLHRGTPIARGCSSWTRISTTSLIKFSPVVCSSQSKKRRPPG